MNQDDLNTDIEAITRVKAKFVRWAETHAAHDDPLIVAMALFDLCQKVLIQALGDRQVALAFLRRTINADFDSNH